MNIVCTISIPITLDSEVMRLVREGSSLDDAVVEAKSLIRAQETL